MSETDVNPYQSPEARIEDRRLNPPDRPPLASLGARLGGAMLDGLFGFLSSIPFLMAFYLWAVSDNCSATPATSEDEIFAVLFVEYPAHMAAWLGLLLLLLVAHLVLVIQRSQSIGKRIVGTQMVTLDGEPAGALRIVGLRVIVSQILYNLPFVGLLISLVGILMIFGRDRRCLHDHVAGTIVVEYRPAH